MNAFSHEKVEYLKCDHMGGGIPWNKKFSRRFMTELYTNGTDVLRISLENDWATRCPIVFITCRIV